MNEPETSLPYFLRGAFRGFETALGRSLFLKWSEAGNSQIDIAERAFITESVASQVLKKMESHDLIRRKANPNDGRGRIVHLTHTGKRLRERLIRNGLQISNEIAPDISDDDMKTTIEVLMKVQQSYDEHNRRMDST